MNNGKLYLVPSFLAETNDSTNFPALNLEIVMTLRHFIVEDARTARRFLRKVGYDADFDEVTLFMLNKHTDPNVIPEFLQPCKEGADMGLISEAGVPCVADPGASLVSVAHALDIQVVPLTGPSSVILALMASGFNGQHFLFHGYLPIDQKEKERKIRDMEAAVRVQRQTQIFIETPYRNNKLFETLLKVCGGDTLLCVASMLTHTTLESVKTRTIREWGKNIPDLHKQPAVFLLYS